MKCFGRKKSVLLNKLLSSPVGSDHDDYDDDDDDDGGGCN